MSPIKYGLYLGDNAKPLQSIFEASATPQYPLGSFFKDEYGRLFRYAKNGASALQAGMIVQGAPLGGAATTLQGAAVVASAVPAGETRIYLNAVTTAQAASLYAEGWAAVFDADISAIYTRRIIDNNALATSGGTGYIDIYEPLPVALTTSDRVALQVNEFLNIIVAPASRLATGLPLGGVNCAVPASHYCWVQRRGMFGFLIKDATTSIGAGPIGPAGTTAGTLINAAEADSAARYTPVIGWSTALWLDEYSGVVQLMCE